MTDGTHSHGSAPSSDSVARQGGATSAAPEKLLSLRRSIDNIDAALVHLLAERFKFTQEVGQLKAANGLPASDPEREAVQIARLRALAEESHLDPGFAEKFLQFIVAEVIQHHEKLVSTGAMETHQR